MDNDENIATKQLKVGVSALIMNTADEILIIARSSYDSMPGVWETPGGGLEIGEDPLGAIIREVKEEVGLDVVVKNVIDVVPDAGVKNNEKNHVLQIYYAVELVNPEQTVKLSQDHSEFKWVKPEDLKEIKISPLLKKLLSE